MDKVIVVIVEGDSDKSLISDRLEEYFEECDVNFQVVGNDVFNMSKTTTIKSNINKHIKSLESIRKFNAKDILCVIHIADTDGCFIEDGYIRVDKSQAKPTIYSENTISVNSEEQKRNIIGRNKAKRNNTNIMNSQNTINFERNVIDYQVYYFSRHLEHVIFNNPNPSNRAKVSEVDNFLEGLTEDIEVWLRGFTPQLSGESYVKDYMESWKHIKESINSLKRCNSIPLIFDYIKNEIDGE